MKQALRNEGTAGGNNTRARQLAARREQMIAVAEQLFLQRGFANTSVNAIVREAGGSLATLYAEFGSKESLFESVLSARAARFFPEQSSAPKHTLDAEAELRALASQMLKRMLSEDGLAVYRLAVHEAPRFPALRKALLEVGMPGLIDRTAGYLQALADRGAFTLERSPEAIRLAAARFLSLVQGQLMFIAACGGTISARTRAQHVNDAVDAFLKIYRQSSD